MVNVYLNVWISNLDYIYNLFYFLTKEGDPILRQLLEQIKKESDLDLQIYYSLRANDRIEELQNIIFQKFSEINNPNVKEFLNGSRILENKVIPQLIYFNYPFEAPIEDIEKEKKKLGLKPEIDFFTDLIDNKLRFKGIDVPVKKTKEKKGNPIQYLTAFEFSDLYSEDYTFPEIIERYCPFLNSEQKEKLKRYKFENGLNPKIVAEVEEIGQFKLVVIQKYPQFKNNVPSIIRYRSLIDSDYLHISEEIFNLRKKRSELLIKIRQTNDLGFRRQLNDEILGINNQISVKNQEKEEITTSKQKEFLQILNLDTIRLSSPLEVISQPEKAYGMGNGGVFYLPGKKNPVRFWLVLFYNGIGGRFQPLKDLQREMMGSFERFDLIRGSEGIRNLIVSTYPQADKELPQLPQFAAQKKKENIKALEALKQVSQSQKRKSYIKFPEKLDSYPQKGSSDETCLANYYMNLSQSIKEKPKGKFLRVFVNQKLNELCRILTEKTQKEGAKEAYQKSLPYLREQEQLLNQAYFFNDLKGSKQ